MSKKLKIFSEIKEKILECFYKMFLLHNKNSELIGVSRVRNCVSIHLTIFI